MVYPDAMVMEEHIVAFIDFLGFAEAVEESQNDKLSMIISTLQDLANMRGQFNFVQESNGPTSVQWFVKPTITTFSDHIVFSYPTQRLPEFGGITAVAIALIQLQQSLAHLAVRAFDVGMLIRGGATVGQLYHTDRVVLGPALNEAYSLESTVSNYPRVAVSTAFHSRWKQSPCITVDADGVHHIDYCALLVNRSIPTGEGHFDKGEAFLQNMIATARGKMEELDARKQLKESAKWGWFVHQLEEALAKLRALVAMASGVAAAKKR